MKPFEHPELLLQLLQNQLHLILRHSIRSNAVDPHALLVEMKTLQNKPLVDAEKQRFWQMHCAMTSTFIEDCIRFPDGPVQMAELPENVTPFPTTEP